MNKVDEQKLAKGNIDQALGAWIDYLNQVRLTELTERLKAQDGNLMDALDTLEKTIEMIQQRIVDTGRGGAKGMHGFIAEYAEVGIGNARQLVKGKSPMFELLDDNGPVDLRINGVDFQMKFVEGGGCFSLNAIKGHLEKYPDFVAMGGRYEIPKNYYEAVRTLHEMPEDVARKLSSSGEGFSPYQYRMVKTFFEETGLTIDDIEPSLLEYDEVQRSRINLTITKEEAELRKADAELRSDTLEGGKPSLGQGVQAAAVSAGIEGATAFVTIIVSKLKEGKRLGDFTEADWEQVIQETGIGTIKGGARGASLYALTNCADALGRHKVFPGAVANSLVTAAFGVVEQVRLHRDGCIDEKALYINAEIVCLDAAVSALSSALGQTVIPVPIIGAVIGNTVGAVIYQAAKDALSSKERQMLEEYAELQRALNESSEAEYRNLIAALHVEMASYMQLLVAAFDPDPLAALEGSCELALSLGVPCGEVLDTKAKVDDYFLN